MPDKTCPKPLTSTNFPGEPDIVASFQSRQELVGHVNEDACMVFEPTTRPHRLASHKGHSR